MKIKALKMISLALILVIFSLVNVTSSSINNIVFEQTSSSEENIITVANTKETDLDYNKVFAARFLNMLNHNYVYGDSFKFVESIVNDSMPALIDLRQNEDDCFIEEQIVTDYVFNMYGIEISDYSEINSDFEQIEGYVYIIPRGFSKYNHEISSITENEDGSFTVKTNVTISSHDFGAYTDVCETLFVKNETSQFGFSIINSNIGSGSVSA